MKTFLKISVFLLAAIALNTQETNAQVKAGVGLAFGSEIEQVGIQADLQYRLQNAPSIQLGGGAIYYFSDDVQDFYELNLNGAYIFYEKFMFKSYGYTGLNYSRSSIALEGSDISEDAFGVNVGIGAEYDFGGLLAFGDLKYVISEFDQPVFSIGLRIPFGGG
jgi:hypothetical protein